MRARMNAGKVSRKTEKNSCKAWSCTRNTEKGTDFLHGQGGTFYVSATKNIRFRNAKRTVRTAETYVSLKENIKIMETLHGFLPEVCKKIFPHRNNNTSVNFYRSIELTRNTHPVLSSFFIGTCVGTALLEFSRKRIDLSKAFWREQFRIHKRSFS